MSQLLRTDRLQQDLFIAISSHLASTWSTTQQIAINGGTTRDASQHDECYFPKDNWRPLVNSERTDLLADSPDVVPSGALWVFAISEALRARFWTLDIEHLFSRLDVTRPKYSSQYRAYVADVIHHLIHDHHLPLAGQCQCDAIVHKPGLRSTRYDRVHQTYTGLGSDHDAARTWDPEHLAARTIRMNIGDEPSELVFINLSLQTIAHCLEISHLPSIGAIAKLFMSRFPDYPVVRLTLNPGEACVLPSANMIYDHTTLNQKDFSIHLA